MKFPFQFCLLILLLSCASKSGVESTLLVVITDFEEINLSSEKHYFDEILNASSLALQGGKILISEYRNVPDEYPRIHIINSNDWTYNKPKGRFGQGPLEIGIPEFIVSQDPESF